MAHRRLLSVRFWLFVALTFCALLLGAPRGAAGGSEDYSPHDDRRLAEALEHARIERAQREEQRARPQARAARMRSRTMYAGLRREEALELARGVFRKFVEEPLWRPPTLAPGDKRKRYLNDHAMLLDVENSDRHRLMVSMLPLRTGPTGGTKSPVSIEPEDRGTFIAPKNAFTRIRLNKRLGDGLELPASGVAVRPTGVEDADARADVTAQRLFWSNVETDTDFMAALLPDGFQTFHQLRSADSPERLALRFDLPQNAELRRTRSGGAEVVVVDRTVATVRPPQAFDADGEDVPVRYELQEDALELVVDHRARDVAYPLMVDPAIVEDQMYWEFDGAISFAGWEMNESHPGSITHLSGSGSWGRGLYTWLEAGKWYPNFLSGTWQYRAPGDSFISAAEFGEMDIYAAGGHGCVVQGFWADYGWNPGWQDSVNYGNSNGASPWMSCATSATGMERVHRVDWNSVTRRNTAAVQLFANGDGSRGAMDLMFLGGAYVTIEDDRAPSSLQHNMPTAWTRTASSTYRLESHDNGLGIYDMAVEGREPGREWWDSGYWTAPCAGGGAEAGTADFRCDGRFAVDHGEQLEEGITEWKLSAWDVAGNGNSTLWTTKVDTTAPWVQASGALRDLEGKTVSQDTSLRVDAHDGEVTLERANGSTYVADRSGVRGVELLVDGQRHDYQQQACDQNCSMSRVLKLSVGSVPTGEHMLKVVAQDGVGNTVTSASWRVTVGAGTVTEPAQGMRVVRRLPLQAKVSTGVTGVAWQYRRKNSEAWTAVPATAMRDAQNNAVTLTNGNVPIEGEMTKFVTWDVASTLAGADGPVEIRGVFTGGLGGASAGVAAFLDQKGLGTRTAREELGPGEVDLLTGNYNVTATDVTIDAFRSDLTVARAYNSREATGSGPLGPGWTLSTPVDSQAMEFAKLVEFADTPVVQVVLTDGSRVSFTKRTWGYESERGHEDLELQATTSTTGAITSYSLSDSEGNVAVFRKSGTEWLVGDIEINGTGPRTRTTVNLVNGRILQINAPNANASTDCGGQKARACRTIDLRYASSTTATSTAPGDYAGRLTAIDFTALDPVQGQVVTQTVARYQYDTVGRLVAAWDPRISPALKTTYAYDANNLLTRVTPPGEEPWTLHYESLPGEQPGNGRVKSISRTALAAGTAVWTLAYGVPLSGSGAPYAMNSDALSTWGQGDVPTDATAIFPPNSVPPATPTDYSRATISYLNRKGEEVNSAAPGGHITTNEYDEFGNVVRELTAANRVRALAAGAGSLARARQLDTQRRYDVKGLRMTDQVGPAHQVELLDGRSIVARNHVRVRYDEGAPHQNFHLPTTSIVSAQLADGSDVDERTTKTKYDWQWRKPVEVIEDAAEGGLKLVRRTVLEGQHGFEVEQRMPKRPDGGDASATKTIYYTATPNTDYRECGDRPEWYMLPCRIQAAAQPGTTGLPDLPVTTYTYSALLKPIEARETTGSHTRVTTTGYDAAGRETSETLTGTSGTALPSVTFGYSGTTGRTTTQTMTDNGVTRRLTRSYDTLGRPTSYTDADGSVSTTSYDLLSRPLTTNDGKGSQVRTYDPASGLITQIDDSTAGVFTAGYDADGAITSATLPGGVRLENRYDESGARVGRRYEQTVGCTANCVWFDESVTASASGRWMTRTSNLSTQRYSYDGAGRLVRVDDRPAAGGCTTREYTYDRNSNRTRSTVRGAGADGACNGGATASHTDHAYDAADRLVDNGYAYDAFGRITSVPARDANGGALTSTYYVNDLVRSQSQDGLTNTYALDPAGRPRTKAVTGTATRTEISHYSDDSDGAAWTEQVGSGRVRRFVQAIDGDLAAIVESDAGVRLQVTNLHGDVVREATVDAGGVARLGSTSEFDEFGMPKSADARSHGWLGAEERSTELRSGVVAMGVRSYLPSIGRFLQPDPIPGASANAYDYALQDPVNRTDLDGRCPVCVVVGVVAVVGAGSAIVVSSSNENHRREEERRKKEAERREADRSKRGAGPSGKPKIHIKRHATKKAARQAAQREGGGRPPHHHPHPKRGRPHFHASGRGGKKKHDGVHHTYPGKSRRRRRR